MRLTTPPAGASWTHTGARTGFEVAFFEGLDTGHRLSGHTTARESSELWSVGYDVTVDQSWRTVAVRASNLTAAGESTLTVTRDSGGRWTANGEQILFHYESSTFDFACDLRYDRSGLIVEYPGIAVREI